MKSYLIGRESNCDIVINDPSNVVSRHHASINVDGGKMTIIDQSSNGTYINGIRISPNTPVPITRKDVVSFAKVANLDWARVPKGGSGNILYILSGVVAAVLIVVAILLLQDREPKYNGGDNCAQAQTVSWSDSLETLKVKVSEIESDYKVCKSLYDSISNVLPKKKDSKALEEIKKTVYAINLDAIDIEALKRMVDRAEDNLKDNNESSASERIAEIESSLSNYRSIIDKTMSELNCVKSKLADIDSKTKNASASDDSGKKTKTKKDEDNSSKEPIKSLPL